MIKEILLPTIIFGAFLVSLYNMIEDRRKEFILDTHEEEFESTTAQQRYEIELLTAMTIGECSRCNEEEQDSVIQVALNRAHVGHRGANNLEEVLTDHRQFQGLDTLNLEYTNEVYTKACRAYWTDKQTEILYFMHGSEDLANKLTYVCGDRDKPHFYHSFYK